MPRRPREAVAIAIVFVAAALWSAAAASVGWFHALSDSYGWTQAEAALRVSFILAGGPWLDYETPVLGPPWQAPHELPVYHLLVAVTTAVTGLALEPAARIVSLAFYYAALGALYVLLGELGVSPRHRLLILAACLISPLYVFWSRAVTVESTALFFSLAFMALVVRYLVRGRWPDALGAVLTGATAFAVKPPTMAAFAFVGGLVWLVIQRRRGYRVDTTLLLGALALLLPVAIGWTWHGHADSLKRLNPLVWEAYSTAAMVRDWVFGPAGLRSRPEVWRVLWDRTVPETVGHAAVLVAAALAVVVAARRRALFLLALAVPVVHFAVFTPLHLGHGYDQYAVGLFVPFAVGLGVVALLERGGWRRFVAWTLLVLAAVACVEAWHERMLPLQLRDAYRRPAWFVRLGRTLAESTRPDDVIVGFGMSANPEVPYYARRRALMWPDWADPSPDGDDVEGVLASIEGQRVGALFACPPGVPDETLDRFRAQAGLESAPRLELPAAARGSCVVYLRPGTLPSSGDGEPAER